MMENKENLGVNLGTLKKTMPPMADMSFLSCTEIFCDPQPSQEVAMEVVKPEKQHFPLLPKVLQVPAQSDQRILEDSRVLSNLLRGEQRYLPRTPDYFSNVQRERAWDTTTIHVTDGKCPPRK